MSYIRETIRSLERQRLEAETNGSTILWDMLSALAAGLFLAALGLGLVIIASH